MDNVKGIEYRGHTILAPMGRYFVYADDMGKPIWHDTSLKRAKAYVDKVLALA